MNERTISLRLNGSAKTFTVAANTLLLNLLRENLGLTGAKYGCGIGECGACAVLIDGRPALACLTLAISLDGKEVTTVEGIGGPDLSPVQEAFLDHGSVQCGYCTPGMVVMATSLLEHNPEPDEDTIRAFLRGNICRCTGYTSIVKAVQAAAEAGPKA